MSKVYSGLGNHHIDGENAKIEGISSFAGGSYNELRVGGVIAITGEVKANYLKVEGVVNASEKLAAETMYVAGVINANSEIRANNANISGVVNLNGHKFEAESINCEGIISSKGEISADKICADGCISAKEVYGDDVKIYSRIAVAKVLQNIKSIFTNGRKRYGSKIEVIEATNIVLEGVKCNSVCGHNIIIGKDCLIENIDCDGSLKIDYTSTVNNVTGNCSKENTVNEEDTKESKKEDIDFEEKSYKSEDIKEEVEEVVKDAAIVKEEDEVSKEDKKVELKKED